MNAVVWRTENVCWYIPSTLILAAHWIELYECTLEDGHWHESSIFANLRGYSQHSINSRDSSVLVCSGITIGLNARRYSGPLRSITCHGRRQLAAVLPSSSGCQLQRLTGFIFCRLLLELHPFSLLFSSSSLHFSSLVVFDFLTSTPWITTRPACRSLSLHHTPFSLLSNSWILITFFLSLLLSSPYHPIHSSLSASHHIACHTTVE